MSDQDDFVSIFWTMIFLAAFASLVIAVFVILPIGVLFASPLLLVAAYIKSPMYAETQARRKTIALYKKTKKVLGKSKGYRDVENYFTYELAGNTPESVQKELVRIGRQIFDMLETGSALPKPPEVCFSIQGAEYRDKLIRIANQSKKEVPREIADTIAECLAQFGREFRWHDVEDEENPLTVQSKYMIKDINRTVSNLCNTFYGDSHDLFQPLTDIIDANYRMAEQVMPEDYKEGDVVWKYLNGTPLEAIFDIPIPFTIPEKVRFEHTHMLAAIGHGKTQTLQWMIARDLEKLEDHSASIIVIDSQGELIRNILNLKDVADTSIVYINPRDIEHPPALNLFDANMDRINAYSSEYREQLTNATIELYEFVMGSILGAELTSKQGVAFRYVIRLILTIPEATIHTLLDVFQHPENYQEHIDNLGMSAKSFFAEEFASNQFRDTRRQVVRRIYTILENTTLERMFTNPRSKLDIFHEMNEGKIILIDTAKDLLKEEGAQILGRFFIAKIVQAAQERATMHSKLPVYLYVDEAQDYFDDRTEIILSQMRKQKVGGVFAHQYLDQMPQKLQSAFMSNTSTKLIGGVSIKDGRAFSGELRREADFIANQPEGVFATHVRGQTERAVPIKIPFFVMEGMEKRSDNDMEYLIDLQRRSYCVEPPSEEQEVSPETPKSEPQLDEQPTIEPVKGQPDEDKPSSEL